jgi:hypothetical protein
VLCRPQGDLQNPILLHGKLAMAISVVISALRIRAQVQSTEKK